MTLHESMTVNARTVPSDETRFLWELYTLSEGSAVKAKEASKELTKAGRVVTVADCQRTMLAKRDYIAKLLPLDQRGNIDRVLQSACTALDAEPKLVGCQSAFIKAVAAAAANGLTVGGLNEEVHIVPYRERCRWEPTIHGYYALARRVNKVFRPTCRVVKEGDEFDFDWSPWTINKHKSTLGQRGAPIAVYATIETEDGTCGHLMEWDEVEQHRDQYSGSPNGAWQTAPEQMAMKTIVKYIFARGWVRHAGNSDAIAGGVEIAGGASDDYIFEDGEIRERVLDQTPAAG